LCIVQDFTVASYFYYYYEVYKLAATINVDGFDFIIPFGD